MKRRYWLISTCFFVIILGLFLPYQKAESSDFGVTKMTTNLVRNGTFELGYTGWIKNQWTFHSAPLDHEKSRSCNYAAIDI